MTPCLLASCPTIDQLHTQRYAAVACGEPVRDDSRRIITDEWVLFSIAFTSVVLRLLSRAPYCGSPASLGWDDWTIFFLLALQLPINIMNHRLIHYGLGQDIWMLEEDEIVSIFKVVCPSSICDSSPQILQASQLVLFRQRASVYFWNLPFQDICLDTIPTYIQLPDIRV